VDSILKIKEDGSATEKVNYIFPADIWKENSKNTPLTAKNLQRIAKDARDQINKTAVRVKSLKVSANTAKRALIIDIVYSKYAVPQSGRGWTAPALGASTGMVTSCSKDNITSGYRADHLAISAVCESVMSSATAELRNRVELSQAVYLPANLKESSYSASDSAITYTLYPIRVKDGAACTENDGCKSGNCVNGLCCIKGKTCCTSANQCPSGQYCSVKNNRNYCIPALPDGQSCKAKEECLSGNCKKGVCCPFGQDCCKNQNETHDISSSTFRKWAPRENRGH